MVHLTMFALSMGTIRGERGRLTYVMSLSDLAEHGARLSRVSRTPVAKYTSVISHIPGSADFSANQMSASTALL